MYPLTFLATRAAAQNTPRYLTGLSVIWLCCGLEQRIQPVKEIRRV